MLISKSIIRGNNFKKFLRAKASKTRPQLISISENHLEVFDYDIDMELKIPYLVLDVEQTFLFHILDSEIIKSNSNFDNIVLLTNCGILILEYSLQLKMFISKAIFPLESCSNRDRLIYLRTCQRYIIAFSLTNHIRILCLNSDSSIYAPKFIHNINTNIVDVICRFKHDYLIIDFLLLNNKSKAFIIHTSKEKPHIEECSEEGPLLLNNNVKDILNRLKIIPYKFQVSPLNNFLFIFHEKGYIIVDPALKNPIKKKSFEISRILICTTVILEKYLQLTFDDSIEFYCELELKKSITEIKFKSENSKKLINKTLILLESEYFLMYDNYINIFFIKYDFCSNSNKLSISLLNEFLNSQSYLLDSKIIQIDENHIYTINGIKGNSRLTRFVKGLDEIKIKSINYYPKIKNVLDVRINPNIQIILINLLENCQLLLINTNDKGLLIISDKIVDKEYYFMNEIILDMKFVLDKYISLISKTRIILFEIFYSKNDILKFDVISNFKFEKILNAQTFEHESKIYFLIFTLNYIRILNFDNFELVEESKMNYSDNISTFDFKVDFNSGLIFIGTFNNNIEIIYYDIISKKFDYKPTKSIKINTESTINNLKFYDNKLFLTLRNGEIAFCSFYNTEFSSFNRFKLSQDESLSIQCIRTLIDEYSIIIFGEEDCFYLTIKSNLETLCKFKFVVNEKYRNFNYFKVLSNESDDSKLCLYQCSDSSRLQLSYFYKNSNSNHAGETIRLFNFNQIARKLVNHNDSHLYLLIEKQENEKILSSIYIYDIENKSENLIILEEEIIKVNSMRILDFNVEDVTMNGSLIYFLFICSESIGQKGVLYIYKIENNIIMNTYTLKFSCEKPLIDCLRMKYEVNKNNSTLAMIMDNKLCAIQLEFDQKNLKVKPLMQQSILNKLISLNTFPSSNHVVIGDSIESFSVLNYIDNQNKFEIIGSDLKSRYLFKTIIGDNYQDIALIQKSGIYSNFHLNDDIYEIKASVDLKELLTEVGIIKQFDKKIFKGLFIASGLLGSLMFIGELNSKYLIDQYGISKNDIISFQNQFYQEYSNFFFKKENSSDILLFNEEPNKNFLQLDLIQILEKDKELLNFPKLKNFQNFNKIMLFFKNTQKILENIG